MEQKKPVNHIIAGLIISLLLIAYSTVVSITSGGGDPKGGMLSYLIIIIGIIFFTYQYARAKNNQESFGELFSYGFKTTTMITLVFVVFLVVLSFIYPELKQQSLDAARLEMEKDKKLSESDIDTGINLVSKYFWVFAIGGTVLGFCIIGAIGSLIGAAIPKKEPKDPFEQTSF